MWKDSKIRGSVYTALGAGVCIGIGLVAETLLGELVSLGLALWIAMGAKELSDTAEKVYWLLKAGELDQARDLMKALVGRDTQSLDADQLAKAVVESIAENTTDACVAPAFWGVVARAPGILGYRAINTMDAMVGHHNTAYERFGFTSARLDDMANWIPARLTALFVSMVHPASTVAIWRSLKDQALLHPSRNAGISEAAFAVGLGVSVGGDERYYVDDVSHGVVVRPQPKLGYHNSAQVEDIPRALKLLTKVRSIVVAMVLFRFRRKIFLTVLTLIKRRPVVNEHI